MEPRLTIETLAALSRPFPAQVVNWKPQATSKDGKKALAVPYVEVRDYHDRLNEIMGADWTDDYEVLDGGAVVVCRLTIAGVTRTDVGESNPSDRNTATSALAQAFKRACVKFGLGAYLYRLPGRWEEYDSQRRRFTNAALARLQRLAQAAGLRYGDGTALSDNPAEAKAYHAYFQAKGKAPESLATLRQWADSLSKG